MPSETRDGTSSASGWEDVVADDRIRSGGVHAVRPSEGGLWQVVDEEDRTVFTGSKPECEDWLDAWENLSPKNRSSTLSAWFGQMMRATWARLFRSTPE